MITDERQWSCSSTNLPIPDAEYPAFYPIGIKASCVLGRQINGDLVIYYEIDAMIEIFPPKSLNQLRTELGSAMNRGSVHSLSIKYS
jgi:hypothetical protein